MGRLVYLASAFYLLQAMAMFGIVDTVVYGQWDGKGGDKLTQGLNILQILVSLWLFSRGFRRVRIIRTGVALALCLVGYLLLSAAWSADPPASVRRGVIYLFVVLGAIGITGNLDSDEFLNLLVLVSGIAAVLSVALLVASPGMVINEDGDFHGIFSQKNVLGQVMAMGALASLHGLRAGDRRARNAAMLALFTFVALASESATSFMTIFFCCGMSGFAILYRKGGATRAIVIILLVILGPMAAITALFPDSILELLGKNPDLTGRTDLWPLVLADIALKPVLGWGYAAFWELGSPAAEEISNTLGWDVPSAHNGLLELLLEVGLIGTGLFVVILTRNIVIACSCLGTSAMDIAMTSLLACAANILVGLTEEVLIDPNAAPVTMFLISGFMCERAARTMRQRRNSTAPRGFPQNSLIRP